MSIERTEVQKSFTQLEGYNCFACAPRELNASGLNLVFQPIPDGAETRFTFSKAFQSYPGFLHGGICSSVLDETMAYAGVFRFHALPFTRTLTLNFRRGVRAETEYLCTAQIVKEDGNSFEVNGAIRDEAGRAMVTASGVFVIPTWEMAQKMLGVSNLDPFRKFFR